MKNNFLKNKKYYLNIFLNKKPLKNNQVKPPNLEYGNASTFFSWKIT
jgi:hypothetical protein